MLCKQRALMLSGCCLIRIFQITDTGPYFNDLKRKCQAQLTLWADHGAVAI